MPARKADSVATAYLGLLAERGVEYLFGNAGTDFAPIIEAYAEAEQKGTRVPQPILAFQRRRAIEEHGEGHLQTEAFQETGIFANAREVPGRFHVFADHGFHGILQGSADGLDVALAAELGHKAPPRLQSARNGLDDLIGFLDPVQGGVGEDGVQWLGNGEGPGVGNLEAQVGIGAAGLGDHLRRTVDAEWTVRAIGREECGTR